MINFIPFQNDKQTIISDKHGNELVFQNSDEQIDIYGSWQGNKESPQFINILSIFEEIQKSISNFSSDSDNSLLKLKKRKDEFLFECDCKILKDSASYTIVSSFLNKNKA